MASIRAIIGPMGSGKTTELLRMIDRHLIAGRRTVVVKPSLDTRSIGVSTHAHRLGCLQQPQGAASVPAISLSRLADACDREDVMSAAVVGIDEGQFFDDLASGCESLAAAGKQVIVAGLSGDSERRGFRPVMELLPLCDSITFLTAVCVRCGLDASFTAYAGTKETAVKVGDLGDYLPLCRRCYLSRLTTSAALPAAPQR